jgi:hypothetical protein
MKTAPLTNRMRSIHAARQVQKRLSARADGMAPLMPLLNEPALVLARELVLLRSGTAQDEARALEHHEREARRRSAPAGWVSV